MHQQHVARAEIGHQIFGAAAEAGDGLPGQPRDKILLKGKAQILPAGFRVHDFRPFHDGLQAASDGLDFGQFGHFRLVTFKSFTLWRCRDSPNVPGALWSRSTNAVIASAAKQSRPREDPGLLRRGACHRAGPRGPDPLAPRNDDYPRAYDLGSRGPQRPASTSAMKRST